MTLVPKIFGCTGNELPPKTPVKGDECPTCNGEGRTICGHSFTEGNLYNTCFTCGGTGSKTEAVKLQLVLKGMLKAREREG